MPKSLLVVGSGAIGIEFASFYRTMGNEALDVIRNLTRDIRDASDKLSLRHARGPPRRPSRRSCSIPKSLIRKA